MEQNLVVQKIRKLQELVNKHSDQKSKEEIYLSFEVLSHEPLLCNRDGLEKILTIISNGSEGDITWKIRKNNKISRGSQSVMDYDLKNFTQYYVVETGIDLHILNPLEIEKTFDVIVYKIQKKNLELNQQRRLIHKDRKGDFYLSDDRIDMSQMSIYYKAFDILCTYHDQDGFLSYEKIEEYLVKNGEDEAIDAKKRNKRIQNALTNENQGFWKGAKINGKTIKNETPSGKKIIDVRGGLGLVLNNPTI